MARPERFVEDGVLSNALCQELCFLQCSLGVRGYRPLVTSVTLHDLVAAEPALIVPVVEARRCVWEATEQALGRELELYPEFTGLLTWHPGAAIGWHHDSNRDYLKQREVAAVAYLNTQDTHFAGGSFQFQAQEPASAVQPSASQAVPTEPATIAPMMGRLIGYTAGPANVHCVQPVESGCRYTLVMWFTCDPAFREDDSVLRALLAACRVPGGITAGGLCGGLPDTMYLGEDGTDIRVAALQQRGLVVCKGEETGRAGITSPDTIADGGGCVPSQADQVGLRCKQASSIKDCSQELVRFGSLATAIQVVSYLAWQQGSLLAPLAQDGSVSGDLSTQNFAAGLDAQGLPLRCACSQLKQAEADLVAYKSKLATILAGAASQWESAGYLGA